MPPDSPKATRLLASLLYEALVVFSLLLIGFLIPQAILRAYGAIAGGLALWLHIFALLGVYFVGFWNKGGQTLPMKTWRLRLVDVSGQRVRLAQCFLRYLAAWPCLLLFGIGILWIFVDPERRFLHDRIAGTRIQKTER